VKNQLSHTLFIPTYDKLCEKNRYSRESGNLKLMHRIKLGMTVRLTQVNNLT